MYNVVNELDAFVWLVMDIFHVFENLCFVDISYYICENGFVL